MVAEILFGLEECVLGSGLGDFQHAGNFRVTKAFHFIEQENIPLVGCKAPERAFQRHAKRRMCAGSTEFHARRQRVHVFIHAVFSTNAAAAQIVAGVDQDAKRPGDKRRLPAKTGDASLDFQEGSCTASSASACEPRRLRARFFMRVPCH